MRARQVPGMSDAEMSRRECTQARVYVVAADIHALSMHPTLPQLPMRSSGHREEAVKGAQGTSNQGTCMQGPVISLGTWM